MMPELIILSVVLVLSVVAHYFLWRSSKKRHGEFMKQLDALKDSLKQLEANDVEIDKMLDGAEDKIKVIDGRIDALRSAWFMTGKKSRSAN